jgi:PAS domain S-box-containing protein
MTDAETDRLKRQLSATQKHIGLASWEFDVSTKEIWWSKQASIVFGQSSYAADGSLDSLLGRVYSEDETRCEAALQDLLSGSSEITLEYRIVTDGGEIQWIHLIAERTSGATGSGDLLIGTALDVTKRAKTELLLSAETRMLKALSLELPLKAVLSEVLACLVVLIPGARTMINLVSADGTRLNPGASSSFPESFAKMFINLEIGLISTCCSAAAHFGSPIIVQDLQTDPGWRGLYEVAQRHNIRACWAVPVENAQGKVLATFTVYFQEPRQPTPEDLSQSHAIADVISIAVERNAKDSALRESQMRFKQTFESAAPGMAITTLEGRFVEANQAYLNLTGYTFDELREIDIYALAPLDGSDDLKRRMNRLAKGELDSIVYERTLLKKNTEHIWIRVSASLLRDADGSPQAIIRIAEDINQEKQAKEEILRFNATLEERVHERTLELDAANKELEAFSYSISHDLRGPLNTVNGFSALLAKNNAANLDEKGKHYLDRIRTGTQQMGELINSLLILSKITRDPLEVTEVDLSKISKKIWQEIRESDPDRKAELHLQDDLIILADPAMMLVVMQNLIGNAWKYSGKKESTHIAIGSELLDSGQPVFFVKDNGDGFDMAYADKLFDPFQRLHSPSEFEGTGVGLANVKRAIERHGGRIWAKAEPGRGAAFYFTTNRPKSSIRVSSFGELM